MSASNMLAYLVEKRTYSPELKHSKREGPVKAGRRVAPGGRHPRPPKEKPRTLG